MTQLRFAVAPAGGRDHRKMFGEQRKIFFKLPDVSRQVAVQQKQWRTFAIHFVVQFGMTYLQVSTRFRIVGIGNVLCCGVEDYRQQNDHGTQVSHSMKGFSYF
jgi:hypothetical protein